MKWIIIAALRISIYLGALATIAVSAMTGYVGGLNIENFAVTGVAGAVVGGVIGILLAGLVFGTLTVLLDIRDSLADLRERSESSSSSGEDGQQADNRKEPFLG